MNLEITYEEILQRMLGKVPTEIDKREGSVIYDALAPAAIELQLMYLELKNLLLQAFGETASKDYLIKIAKERGIDIFPPTKTLLKVAFNDELQHPIEIAISSRFSIEELNYVVLEKLSDGMYIVECETAGEAGNVLVPIDLIPIAYVPNLASAKAIEIVRLGQNEESTEHLRERYFAKAREPATSGNVAHYKLWTMEVPGVGGVKVFPLHAGAGTVKLIIVDSKMQAATKELIQAVKEHIEEVRPIGATVTVESATKKEIAVSVKVKTIKGADLPTIKSRFSEALKSYFKTVSFNDNYISITKIGSILLSTSDVLDHTDLKLNSQTGNVELLAEEIPFLSSLEVEVIP